MTDGAPRSRRRFGRDLRVRRRAEFDRAFAAGLRASAREALLVAAPNDVQVTRLGVSVGRKFGNAPKRNRAKRLLREAFRAERERLPPGLDLIVVPRTGFPDRLDDVKALLIDLAQRAARSARPRAKDAERKALP